MSIKYIKVPSYDLYSDMAYKYKNGELRIPEHRYIMAQHLRRCLTSDEVVHHKNGDDSDNRLSNLLLTDKSNHSKIHRKLYSDRIARWQARRAKSVVNAELARNKLLSDST